jgi:hypothetical protein
VVTVRKKEKEAIPKRLKAKNFPEIMVQPMMKVGIFIKKTMRPIESLGTR